MAATQGRVDALVLEPLRRLGLPPEVLELRTTEDRLSMRVRLAADGQLGAHTPRPLAPRGSLASLQIHESAINNALDKAGLAGNSFTLSQLMMLVAQKLNRPVQPPDERFRDDVRVTFADEDPVRVRFARGRAELTLQIARLAHGRRQWDDFTVRVSYRPGGTGLVPRLERDGTIQLHGNRFGTRPQVILRGIFSKLFPPESTLNLLPSPWNGDRRLEGLAVTQFELVHGWMGLAWGDVPRRAAREARLALAGAPGQRQKQNGKRQNGSRLVASVGRDPLPAARRPLTAAARG
jgi:hypothetical protein